MDIEVWKDIEGYEGLYQVSTLGNVKSLNYLHTGKEGILKLRKEKKGYLSVVLCKNDKGKSFKIHRLVALAFIPNDNPTEKTEINHLDENKQNNHVSNLCWCTRKENVNYGTRNEIVSKKLKGENNPMFGKKHTEETKQKISDNKKEYFKDKENHPMYGKISPKRIPILQFTKEGEFIKEFDSAKSASLELGIDSSGIGKCCKGRYKMCGGFIWKYKN